ncbi:alpha/beta hydrolase [Phormidium tenue FACHB-886]|nr:alpha/beta hydrolase [Phormidium tenue FACHB-886]
MTAQLFSLPASQLTEPTSIALAQAIERRDISTPLSQTPIATTYVHQGSGGTPILLLHGFDSSVFEFRRLLPLLAAQHETWAIDLLGFGFTGRSSQIPVSPLTIKTHLYHAWKTLIEQPVVLVGASMGGAAAIDFALTYPKAVKQLVLIDSAGFSVGLPVGRLMVQPLGHWATSFLRSPKVRQSISLKAYYDPSFASLDALECAALHLNEAGWQQALIAFTQSGGYRSFKRQLTQLQQPTLILWGRQDRILGTKDAAQFQRAIPKNRLVWIERCGHVPHLEQPQLTATQILEFVG